MSPAPTHYHGVPTTPSLVQGEETEARIGEVDVESSLAGSPRAGAQRHGYPQISLRMRYKPTPQYTSIDWITEYNNDRHRRSEMAQETGVKGFILSSSEGIQMWLILILTGALVGILASCLIVTSTWLSDLRSGHCATSWILSKVACCQGLERDEVCYEWQAWDQLVPNHSLLSNLLAMSIYALFSTLLAGIGSWLISKYSPLAFHTGIPEMKAILGGYVFDDYLKVMVLFVKSLSLAFASASGLVLGKEGPLVHIACCIGHVLATVVSWTYPQGHEPPYLYNNAKRREILSAASAAGVSVAFGAPVGGVLFALEEISYYYPDRIMWHSFVCAMLAALTLQRMDPFRTGKLNLYEVTSREAWRGFELPFFVFLGIAGGLCGALFVRANVAYEHFRKGDSRLALHPIREVILLALSTSVLCYFLPYSRVSLSELVEHLFSDCEEEDWENLCSLKLNVRTIAYLLITAFLKYVFSIATFGALVPAGIFLPSLAIGACLGRAVGIMVETLHQATKGTSFAGLIFSTCPADGPCISPAVYAVIGAASLMGGITRMTLSLVVILFELTGALTYVLPIMIAVMTSKWVGDSLTDNISIYEAWIRLRGYPFLAGDNEHSVDPSGATQLHRQRLSFHASRTNLAPEVPLEEANGQGQEPIVANVMKPLSALQVIEANHFSLAKAQSLMRDPAAYFRGFPIILSKADPILIGYISRENLENITSRAYLNPEKVQLAFTTKHLDDMETVSENTTESTVLFANDNEAHDGDIADSGSPKHSGAQQIIDMRPRSNITPLTLPPHFAIAQTNTLFKRMGPRYILVARHGRLCGLVTKSDLWRRANEQSE